MSSTTGAGSAACPSDEMIALFLEGMLDDARSASFRSHLDGCDACRVLLAEAGRSSSAPAIPRAASGERPPPEDVAVGQVLAGKYQVEAVLGTGGMGKVVRAMHLELGRPVAIKIMHAELLATEDAARRFSREARAAAALQSHHAVRILDIDRLADGLPYIVMEHLEGKDFHRVLVEEGPLAPARVVDYALQAIDAVAEAHAQGIIHRDLKPHNLFLTDDDVVKVLDFGLAKTLPKASAQRSSDDTKATALVGTPQYMAPEQIRGSRRIDARTDVYGLGATMYQLLTGSPPFLALNLYVLCARILSETPAPIHRHRGDVPAGIEEVIMRCLEKDRARRPASVTELAEALHDARLRAGRGEGPIVAPRATAPGLDSTQREQDLVTLPGATLPTTGIPPSPYATTTVTLKRDVPPPTDPAPPPVTERLPRRGK